MIYPFIDALVAAIKEEDVYHELMAAEEALQEPGVQQLLTSYQDARERQKELAAHAPYIDLTDIDREVDALRAQVESHDAISTYQACYVRMSRMLDDVTELVFQGISDDLTTGRMGKLYARYRRKV